MGMPLLLVEDTPSLSLVYKTVLNKADHQVECAYTLQEAQANESEASDASSSATEE